MAAIADYVRGPKERKREFYLAIYSELCTQRQGFETYWQDLNAHVLPSKARFVGSQPNQPELRNQSVIDSSPMLAARVLGEGMNAGITSQARPWFRLGVSDDKLSNKSSVKNWLHQVTTGMTSIFSRSNFYDVMPALYKDAGVYGTSVIGIDEDDEDVLFFQHFPIGSYWIADDSKGRVRVWMRRFKMTVRQLIQKFGTWKNGKLDDSNLSIAVANAYRNGQLQAWIDVMHVVMQNQDHDPRSLFAKDKEFSSCYFESGEGSIGRNYISRGSSDEDKYLSESGYDYFPLLAFRWEVNGEDSYGTGCPGMIALGDCKGLQKMESMKLQAIEKKVKPPMNAPPSMRNQKLSILPAAVNFTNQAAGQTGFQPTFQLQFDITELREEIRAAEGRIDEAFYKQIFLALTMDDRLQRATAEEIREIKLEKFTVLGSVLERVNVGILNPLIDIVFKIMLKRGLIPTPPPELQGMNLKVEYISILAQAQKMLGTSSMRQFIMDVMGLTEVFPSAADKINVDRMIDDLGEAAGVSPEIINDEDEAAAIRQARAEAQQAEQMAQQAAAMQQGTAAVKNLSDAKLSGGSSVLDELSNRSAAGQLVGAE